jgi:hypothetical protein
LFYVYGLLLVTITSDEAALASSCDLDNLDGIVINFQKLSAPNKPIIGLSFIHILFLLKVVSGFESFTV